MPDIIDWQFETTESNPNKQKKSPTFKNICNYLIFILKVFRFSKLFPNNFNFMTDARSKVIKHPVINFPQFQVMKHFTYSDQIPLQLSKEILF